MARPTVVYIRHQNDVFRIDGATMELLDPDDANNENVIRRTYQSPFLDGLAYAGGFGTPDQATDGSRGADHNTGSEHLNP